MPRRGRRSEAAKLRWKKMDLEPDIAKPRTPPPTRRAWTPTQSPEKKMARLLEPVLPDQMPHAMVCQDQPRRPSTSLGSRRGTGHHHRVRKWPASRVTRRCLKLVLPAKAPEKKFALLVGDSHLRAVVDGFVTLPETDFSLGVLASPGASAEELRLEVLDADFTRAPDVVCLLAPSNNLTASRTVEKAGEDFGRLLNTIGKLCANVVVVDFPPHLVVEEKLQQSLRQEFHRVAAQRGVPYLPVTEHFPLSSLQLWSKDGVHLSDSPGMEILAQLLWAAICSLLEVSAPKSPAPVMTAPPPVTASPPVVRRPAPRLVVVGEVAPWRPSNPFDWSVVRGGQKTSRGVQTGDGLPHATGRMVDQQGGLLDSSIPTNPVWFSPTVLKEMDRLVPVSGLDAPLPPFSPRGKKKASVRRHPRPDPSKQRPEEQQVEGAPMEMTRLACHQARSAVPPMEADVSAESSPVPLEDHVQDGSCQASALEPCISGPRVLSVRATHSQGDNRYRAFSRNHQCTCMALTFLAYHNEGLQFDTMLLDRVIKKGDKLYASTKRQLMRDGTFRSNHLTVEEMPSNVMTEKNIYEVHTTGIRVGHVLSPGGSPRGSRQMGLPLALQLECLSENVTHAFLLVTPECIAVFRDRNGRFGVFDSHSRDSAGLPHPNGTAVMMTFSNLSGLVNHLHQLFQNRGPNATYEFVPVSFVRDNDPSQDLAFQNISPEPTQASPTVRKSESSSDKDKMPPWLSKIANILEETTPTVPNVSKVEKSKRRKVRNRVKAQLGDNAAKKQRRSTLEKERYVKSPEFRTKKLQAIKKNIYSSSSQKERSVH
ncbi:uncharacterized protein LOC108228509 [Kryptolebias marmoratus]|uniref:uncharacterized protein LOC108228509 n=1 Tax=Kryptolebias marmoratus TaxID=37003 RepID=UPI0018ACAAFC|nr:uncharacterized protein LOC108228509 [Kryptolebias marmoratus]